MVVFTAYILQVVIGVVPTLILLVSVINLHARYSSLTHHVQVLSLGHLQADDARPQPPLQRVVLQNTTPAPVQQMVVRPGAPLSKPRVPRRDSLSIDLSDLNSYPEREHSTPGSTKGSDVDIEAQRQPTESGKVVELVQE
jgi:hypothetical protein